VNGSGDGSNLSIGRRPGFPGSLYSPVEGRDHVQIYNNQGLSIDLQSPGPTENSGGSIDAPVITSATLNNGFLDITGTNSASGGYFLQFYATKPTVSGRGQADALFSTFGQLAGMSIPAAVTTYLADYPNPLYDQDLASDQFRFRINVGPEFDARLLTAVIVDPTLGKAGVSFPGVSEFSQIVSIGTQLTQLPPIVDAGGDELIFAGQALTRTITFRDDDSVEFQVVVDYGDGSGFEYAQYRPADRTIYLDHAFTEVGTYVVSVSVLDDSAPVGLIDIGTFLVTVENTPPEIRFNEVALTKRVREGELVDLSGFFDDSNIADWHTVTVNWGDGTQTQQGPREFSQSNDAGDNPFSLTHIYRDDGVSRANTHLYRVVVNVTDEHGGVAETPVFLIEVDNVLPTIVSSSLNASTSLTSRTIDEGDAVTLFGQFTDPGVLDSHSIYVNWGDGSPRERVPGTLITQSGAARSFQMTHVFGDNPAEDLEFFVTWEVADDDDPEEPISSAATALTVTVNNVAPTGEPLLLSRLTIEEGVSVALYVEFVDPGTETHFVSVNWGDGNVREYEVAAGLDSTTVVHQYLRDGVYTVSATVRDRDAAASARTATVTVTNYAPVIAPLVLSATEINEGESVTLTGSFADLSPRDTPTVLIRRGDGTTSSARIDRAAGTFTATHRYDDGIPAGSMFTIAADVSDGTVTTTRSTTITVLDVAPVVNVVPVVDVTNVNPVFRAIAFDPSRDDQAHLTYVWSVTQGGTSVPFSQNASGTEIEISAASISSSIIVTLTVFDNDGGASDEWKARLIAGTSGNDSIAVTDSDFSFSGLSVDQIIVLGFAGDDVLNASGVTNASRRVILFGGAGDDLLFDGSGHDTIVLGDGNDTLNDPANALSITPNMSGNDVVFLVPNSVLTAYDGTGNNTLSFLLADSTVTQTNGITFDLSLTQGVVATGTVAVQQDVAPLSAESETHFVAALGRFTTLIGSDYGDWFTGASGSTVSGGFGADNFFTKDDIVDAVFAGGADADVLTARGRRVARIRFDGDDGGDDADVFINRGRVSRVVFKGGSDADLLQNQRGRISRIRFEGDDGADTFINEESATIDWQSGDDPTLQAEQGVDFDGGNDADVFINRGRVSRVVFKGGSDADVLQNRRGRITKIQFNGDDGDDVLINETDALVEWQTGDDTTFFADNGIYFDGGDDADVLISRARVGRIRFDGDAGSDTLLITGTVEGAGTDGGLVEFNGGDDADLLVSRGTLRRLVFRGGADDDVLQTTGGSIQDLEFYNDSGLGILINRTDNIQSLKYDGGAEEDMFINRGNSIRNLTFLAKAGDDVFVNSGSTNTTARGTLMFDGGEGSNAMRNEGINWLELIYIGGAGSDFLQNNATDIDMLDYDGGIGANALENNADGLSNIMITGNAGDDIFANDGNSVTGITFDGLDGRNTFINTGNYVSDVTFTGGSNADRFVNSGDSFQNATFNAGAGDDWLILSGASSKNITMNGGAGADVWFILPTANTNYGTFNFSGGDGDDVLVNRGRTIRNVTFDGGNGNDFLQLEGQSTCAFTFNGGDGNDILLHASGYASDIQCNAGAGDDVFESRAELGGYFTIYGGDGDDAYYQNVGYANGIDFYGENGDDTLLNFANRVGQIAFDGGAGIDVLQNTGNDISSIEFTGGGGRNTLQNFGNRIASLTLTNADASTNSSDTLLNSGSTIGSVIVESTLPSTLISSGNNVTAIQFMGSLFNDVVQVTGSNIGLLTFDGNFGDDTLLVDIDSGVGSAVSFNGSHGQDLFVFRGNVDGLVYDGGADDDQIVFAGQADNAVLRGGSGDDLYRFAGDVRGNVVIDEVFTGEGDTSRDTINFSAFLNGPITLDLELTTGQSQLSATLVITLTDGMGIENVIGTSASDTILGNARDNVLSGARFLPSGTDSGTPVAHTKTQWVVLDFFTKTSPGELVYSQATATAIRTRIEQTYSGFDVRFVIRTEGSDDYRNSLPSGIRNDDSAFVTIYFNDTPGSGRPGGEASEIDPGNINPGGTASVQVSGLLGGREVLSSGLVAVAAASGDGDEIQAPDISKPAATEENMIALSAKLAAHEFGHLLGVRHYVAFGPVGFGIHAPPGTDRFKPNFVGVAAAFETSDHVLSSPASVGTTRFNDLRQLYFGEREAIKLALAFSDPTQTRLDESTDFHGTFATAQPLSLMSLSVPNSAVGSINEGMTFHVQAIIVSGTIELAESGEDSGKSQSDWYSFAGNQGDVITVEVMSRALQRYRTDNATSIDSVVRLYDANGQLVQTFGTDAVNDDEFESSDSLLMDITLPTDGTYYIEVDTFRRLPGDASYAAAVALRQDLESRRDDSGPQNDLSEDEADFLTRLVDSLDDIDTGNYELQMYRSTSASATDGIDDLQGHAGVDVLNGGTNDDYWLTLTVGGAASSNEGSAWNGSATFTDRGGFTWTAVVNYGDGSSPVSWSPTAEDRGTNILLSHVFAAAGDYTVTVTFTNDDGLTDTMTFDVDVNNAAPTATLSGPATGFTGTPATYTVSASDPSDGTASLSYSWTVTRNGTAFATQSGGTSYQLNASLPGTYHMSVTVSNGSGGIVTKSMDTVITAAVVSFDVGSGMTQRSWIDALDVVFGSQQIAADLMANPNRVKITRFSLNGPNPDGSGGMNVNFGGASGLVQSGSNLKLQFGSKVIGNGVNSTAADGYYRLELDFDGDGITDATEYFYRLLGDVNGDHKVDTADANLILAGMSKPYNRNLDINGDDVVNGTDRVWTQRSNRRKLKDGLFVDD